MKYFFVSLLSWVSLSASALPPGFSTVEDLRPIDAIVGDADVVALGEGIHTSGGFHQIRLRALKHLILEKGFRVVSLESSWSEGLTATRYVENGEGTLSQAVGSIFSVFQSQEMAEMFQWLSDFNRAHPDDRVQFYGFDIQKPVSDFKRIQAFIQSSYASEAQSLVDGMNTCIGAHEVSDQVLEKDPRFFQIFTGEAPIAENDYRSCIAGIRQISQLQIDDSWVKLSLISFEGMQGHLYDWSHQQNQPFGFRDRAMVDVFLWQRQNLFLGKKVVIIAHDGHIMKNTDQIPLYGGGKSMGSHLANELKSDYVNFSIGGYDVKTNWPNNPNAIVPLPSPTSFDFAFHELAPKGALLIDTQSPYFSRTEKKQYGSSGPMEIILSNHFSGVFFVDQSPGMVYYR